MSTSYVFETNIFLAIIIWKEKCIITIKDMMIKLKKNNFVEKTHVSQYLSSKNIHFYLDIFFYVVENNEYIGMNEIKTSDLWVNFCKTHGRFSFSINSKEMPSIYKITS